MPAIIKDKTKYQSAADYRGLIAAGTTSLYYYFGNPVSWATYPGGSFNESTPPTPKDTQETEREIWDGIIGLKKVALADTKLGFRRVNWSSGQYYDMYREDYDGTVAGVSLAGDITNTKPLSLARSNNVVLVDVVGDGTTYRVYRCIDNRSNTTGNPIASTTKPTHTTTTITTTADGYKWKYLGQLDSTDINEFLTSTVCPIPTTLSTATLSGGVSAVVMTNKGLSYTGTPTVTIKGDGAGLVLGTPVIVGGQIVYIPVTTAGSGYTYVELSISGTGTLATAKAILSPVGGFAYDVEKELEPNFLCVRTTNINTDSYFISRGTAATSYGTATDFTSNTPNVNGLVYRSVGLIENPYNYGTTTKATSNLLTNFTEFRFSKILGLNPSYGSRYYTAASGSSTAVCTTVGYRVNGSSFNPTTDVNVGTNQITFSIGHSFVTAEPVSYSCGAGTTIVGSGINNGSTLYVIRDSSTQIKLATSAANANAGTEINLTGIGTGTVHKLTSEYSPKAYVSFVQTRQQKTVSNPLVAGNTLANMAGDSISSVVIGPYKSFNGSTAVSTVNDTITMSSHPFITGDQITYSNGGGTSITASTGLLTNGGTYYVIKNSIDNIKLATSLANANAGTAIDLTVVGSGSNHSITYSGSDLSYNPTVERYSGSIIFAEYRTPATRATSEKFRFLLEF